MPMSKCDRCGIEDQETHAIRALGWEGELRAHRYADGAFIGGNLISLCDSCRSEFVGMLQAGPARRYDDPPLPT
jgi:hypothetical protein